MNVIGHRGCAAEFPENTLAAIRGAAPHVDLIELDVRRCRSGELVIIHDECLDRLTDATGAVREFEYADLAEMTVGDSDESLPRLTDAVDALPADTGLNIELKEPGLHKPVLRTLSGHSHELIISSFDPTALEPLESASVSTALLCVGAVETAVETALKIGCEYLHPQYAVVDDELIRRAQEQGLCINAWTVPSTAEVRRLADCGIDGVIVDTWNVVPAE